MRQTSVPISLRRRGFTLVELLVVIGIIGLLIGILMPALAVVKRESKKTVCKVHLQQIGNAVRLYTDQYKGRYPRAPAFPSVNPYNLKTAQEYLAPFIGVGSSTSEERVLTGTGIMKIFECPADEIVFPNEKTSYFYHQELGEKPVRETFMFLVYKDMSRIPVFWDADHYHGGTLPFNWLYVDGHVEHWNAPISQ